MRTAPRWLAFMLASLLGSGLILHQSAMALTADAPSGPGIGAPAPLSTDATGPLFGGEPLTPGDSSARCVSVSFSGGPAATEVRMLASVTDDGLGPWVMVVVEVGRGGTYDDCSGFVADRIAFEGTLAALGSHDRFGHGIGAWAAETGGTHSYRITTTLIEGAPPGASADADFHWEVRAP